VSSDGKNSCARAGERAADVIAGLYADVVASPQRAQLVAVGGQDDVGLMSGVK